MNGLTMGRAYQALRSFCAPARSWAGKGTLAIADQGLIAASNFLLAILLARQLPVEQYGAWALAFEIFLLLAVLHSSFILEPMTVFGPATYKQCLREYLGTILRVHGWLMFVVVCVLAFTAWIVHLTGSDILAKALLAVGVASPSVLIFWVLRRAFYIELNPGGAVWGAAIYSASLLAGLGVCYRFHLLSPFTAFVLMGVAALITIPVLFARLKPGLHSASPAAKDVVLNHWKYGRWALASSIATWGTLAVLYFLLTSFRGLAATGQLKALFNIGSPIGTAFVAISMLTVSYGSRLNVAQNAIAMLSFARRLTVFYMGGTLAYFAAIAVLRHSVLHLLYGNKYSGIAALIPWIAVGMTVRIGATAQAVPLRALQIPSLVFVSYGASFLVAVVVGVPATWAYGLAGTVLAYIAASVTAIVFAYCLLRRRLQRSLQPTAEFQAA